MKFISKIKIEHNNVLKDFSKRLSVFLDILFLKKIFTLQNDNLWYD